MRRMWFPGILNRMSRDGTVEDTTRTSGLRPQSAAVHTPGSGDHPPPRSGCPAAAGRAILGHARGLGTRKRPVTVARTPQGLPGMTQDRSALDTLLTEKRRFAPPAGLRRRGARLGFLRIRQGRGLRRVLGRLGGAARLVRTLGQGPGVEPAPRPVVHRGQTERQLQLHRPSPAGATPQARAPVGGGAWGTEALHVRPAGGGGGTLCERAEGPRGEKGRPGRDLPAHDPRGGLRHAGLRADRRAPFGRVRGIQPGLARGPDQRCRGQGAGYGGRRMAAGGRSCRSRPTPTARWRAARASSTSWWCRAATSTSTRSKWCRVAITGTTISRSTSTPSATRSRWTRRTSSTFSTPPAPPANPREWSTPPAATSPRCLPPRGPSST